MNGDFLFTSESVTEGHPDKVADQISDKLLDTYLEYDPNSRVALETTVSTNLVTVIGEVKSSFKMRDEEFDLIIRDVIAEIGYIDTDDFDAKTVKIIKNITTQSDDISIGVDKEGSLGAGDQGMMFGYACNESSDFMPLPIFLAHCLTYRLTEVRKKGMIPFLGPDGKAQVTVQYKDGKPERIHTIVLSTQHRDDIEVYQLKSLLETYVINRMMPNDLMDSDTIVYINPTGRFVKGGPGADSGLTGRKIIVDTYGGYSRHGGGAFSGKDSSKVDRSGAYMCRLMAKSVVASGLADKCEIQISYVIGREEPISLFVDTFGTGDNESILKKIKNTFPLTPGLIIEYLELDKPVYYETAKNGHFGGCTFEWEKERCL